MKRIICTILVFVTCVCSYAQEEIVDVKTLQKTEVEKEEPLGMDSYKKNPRDTFTNEQFTQQTLEASEDNNAQVWKVALSLAFVLAILVAFLYGLKKFSSRFMGIQKGDMIRVASRVPLDNKNSLVMVRVYEEELLVGVGPNGINLISRFAPFDNEEELIESQKERTKTKPAEFEAAFQENMDIDSEEIL